LTGEVKKFATITPGKAFLKGVVGEKISRMITIVPETEEPFAIVKVVPLKGSDFRYSLEEIELDGKKAYRLTVENAKETEGRYSDKLTIITDRSDYIPLSIVVSGIIQKAPSEKKESINIKPSLKEKGEG
jgi:hypothetical protein